MCRTIGFTLIELSLVLIIIGLVAGGILIGRDLIRAAELRSLHRQYQEFATAANTFRLKYDCLPGDCDHAITLFGAAPGCPPLSGSPAFYFSDTPGVPTCNGDGDSYLDAAQTLYEVTTFWQHLADAGLIAGHYSGGWSSLGTPWIGGLNTPLAFDSNIHWMVVDGDQWILFSPPGTPPSLVPMSVGVLFEPITNTNAKPFTSQEAAAHDTKFDDGTPIAGNIRVATGSHNCTTAADESISTAANNTARYLSADETGATLRACQLFYRSGL